MNMHMSERVISKPECMVHLAGLDLVDCSENIKQESISGHYRLSEDGRKQDTLLDQYKRRGSPHAHMSLKEYFYVLHPDDVPVFVGGTDRPRLDKEGRPDERWARTMVLIHKPWTQDTMLNNTENWVELFMELLVSDNCPQSLKIAYQRLVHRKRTKTDHVECTASGDSYDHGQTANDDVTTDLIRLATSFDANQTKTAWLNGREFCKGIDYNWGGPQHWVSAN